MQEFFVGKNFEKMAREYNEKYSKKVFVFGGNDRENALVKIENTLNQVFDLAFLLKKHFDKNPKFLPVLSRLERVKNELKFDCENLFLYNFNWCENCEKETLNSPLNHKIFVEKTLKIASELVDVFKSIFVKNEQKNAIFFKENVNFDQNYLKNRNNNEEKNDKNFEEKSEDFGKKNSKNLEEKSKENFLKKSHENFEIYFESFCENFCEFFLQLSVFYDIISKEFFG